jgi:hypothetical protein
MCLVVRPAGVELCDSSHSMIVRQNVAIVLYAVYNTSDIVDCVRLQCLHGKKTRLLVFREFQELRNFPGKQKPIIAKGNICGAGSNLIKCVTTGV